MLKNFAAEKFDIIIQAGQSNSEGCGLGAAENPYIPNGDIWYLNNDFTISMAQELAIGNEIIGNFSLAFCTEYIKNAFKKLESGRKILIIRAAVGGTGFLDNRWKLQDDLFLRMMEMTKTSLDLNPENRLAAFIWHQGETDALLNASEETHYKNLSTLVNTVRDTFGCKNLPFIAGDFVHEWKSQNETICTPVIAAIRSVCDNIGNSKFVETSELLSNNQKIGNGDIIHFCRDSINKLGIKYYSAYSELI